MMESEFILSACVFLTALLYSSVGHGGASGYLALMALLGFPAHEMRPNALILNILVAGLAFSGFKRAGKFSWRLAWPFLAASVPAAFLGGMFQLRGPFYGALLGLALAFAAGRIFFASKLSGSFVRRPCSLTAALFSGTAIGFLSGALGIGGGVFLSPLMLLFGWADVKEAAAVSALFILLNSVSGFAGLALSGIEARIAWYLILPAFAGGVLGSWAGSQRIPAPSLARVLAAVLFSASMKLIAGAL